MAGLSLGIGIARLPAGRPSSSTATSRRRAGPAGPSLVGYLALAAGFIYLRPVPPGPPPDQPVLRRPPRRADRPERQELARHLGGLRGRRRLPGSIKTAIGQKAARDLKGVDLNRAIENRKILWLAIAAGVLAAGQRRRRLPPADPDRADPRGAEGRATSPSSTIRKSPFQVRVRGRIPDAERRRTRCACGCGTTRTTPRRYEERPMKAAEGDRRKFDADRPGQAGPHRVPLQDPRRQHRDARVHGHLQDHPGVHAASRSATSTRPI